MYRLVWLDRKMFKKYRINDSGGTMRENIILAVIFCAVLMTGAVIVAKRYIQVIKKSERAHRDNILNNIANNSDVIIVVYSYQKKMVEYVSDSVSWMFGIDKKEVIKDVAFLFHQLKFSPTDEVVRDFQCGNLQLFVQKEYEVVSSESEQKRWIRVKIVPYQKGRYLLIVQDKTMEHELSETLLITVNAMDDMKQANHRLFSMMEQNEPERSAKKLFEQPELVIKVEEEEGKDQQNDVLCLPEYNGKRILLVEDNTLNLERAYRLLKYTGVKIDTAINGEQAVERFRSSCEGYYDLVFMDIQMPIMDGNEATRKIRAMERKDAKVIPIVAMTAYIFAEDIRISLKAGMDMHITKPLDVQKLSDVMKKYLAKSNS